MSLQACSAVTGMLLKAGHVLGQLKLELPHGTLNSWPSCRDMKVHQPHADHAHSTCCRKGMQSASHAAGTHASHCRRQSVDCSGLPSFLAQVSGGSPAAVGLLTVRCPTLPQAAQARRSRRDQLTEAGAGKPETGPTFGRRPFRGHGVHASQLLLRSFLAAVHAPTPRQGVEHLLTGCPREQQPPRRVGQPGLPAPA